MNDTIAAISTALGVGAISIIRVSGPDSINIVNKILTRYYVFIYVCLYILLRSIYHLNLYKIYIFVHIIQKTIN